MNPFRTKIVLCSLLAALAAPSFAQQSPTSALGSAALARRRAARFLSERGLATAPGTRSRYSRGPAQMLAEARVKFSDRAQQNSAHTVQVPSWQPVGPAQVSTPAYGAVAGRVTSIAADPSDPTGNTIYLGTASGGVWKSTNAAENPASVTFSPLTDFAYPTLGSLSAPSLSIGAISVQPVSPGATPVLLAGTGDPNDTTASYFGDGILRSTDGGNQWSVITQSSDATTRFSFVGDGFAGFAWGSISGNPVVVAAVSQAEQGVQVDAAGAALSVLGLYYSTDLGQTWYMATINDPGGTVQSATTAFSPCSLGGSRLPCGNAVTSVVWNPVRQQFLAAVRFHGYYESRDGQTWTRLPSQPGANLSTTMCPRLQGYPGSQACPIYNGVLAVQPVTGDIFALTTDINNLDQGLWQDSCQLTSGACASSTLAFTQLPDSALEAGSLNPSQPTMIPQADYDLYLAAVPSTQNFQPDTLLFAGTADVYRCDLAAGCAWRNTTHAQSSDCNSAHVAPAQFAIDSTFGASGLLYFSNAGGVWRSTDAVDQQQQQCSPDDAAHFQNLNSGFTGSIAEVEDVAPDPTNPQNIMASLGPLGTAAPIAGTDTWQQVLNGEGDYAAIDPENPQNWYATSEFGIGINLCTQGPNCGIAEFGLPVISGADIANDGYGQIIPAPWILDPQNSANLILGTCRVWRGPASGGIQNQLSTMLDGDNGPYCDGNAEIRSLAASGNPSDPAGTERIYAGMAGLYDGGATVAGHIFAQSVAGDVTSSWTDLSYNLNNFNPGGFDISSIYVDPHSPGGQTIYVTLQGFATVLLYRSNDGGSTWQVISWGLPAVPANSVVVDPNNSNTVYVATDAGVFYTQNVTSCTQSGSDCWSAFGTSLPSVPVTQLAAVNTGSGAALFAGTYGRGVWQISLGSAPSGTGNVTPSSLSFGNQRVQTVSAPQQLLVTNTGSTSLQISSISVSAQFTESDTCAGQSVAVGHACIIEVSFAPTSAGPQTGLVTIYGSFTSGGQLTVPLSGTGTQGAAVTLTPLSLCFAATLIGQTSSASCQSGSSSQQPQSIVIANTGGTAATLTSVSVGGDFAIAANTCGSALAPANSPNDSCTVSINFQPAISGNRFGALTVVDSAGTQTAQLAGIGQTPATDVLSPLSLTFASQAIGSSSPAQMITLTNTGDQALQTIAVQSSTTAFTAANTCGTTLAGHSSCAIMVSFVPAGIGPQSGTVTITDSISQGSSTATHMQTVAVTGTGVAPAGIVSAAPASLDFGYYAVGQTSQPQTVTLTNNGTATITGLHSSITSDFALQSAVQNSCGATLPVGESCNVGVVFKPSQVTRSIGTLTITGANLPVPLVVALAGSGSAFTMKIDGSSSQVITGTQTAQPFQVEIDSVSNSQGPVALTCAVVPSNAACTATPGSVTLTGNNSQLASVTFTAAQQAQVHAFDWKKAACAFALLLPIGVLARRRRAWWALTICVFLSLLIPIGCGVASSSGGNSSSAGQSPSPTGQYTLTVTGSIPGLTQTVTMQVTVQ